MPLNPPETSGKAMPDVASGAVILPPVQSSVSAINEPFPEPLAVRRGRPPLSEAERARREQWNADKKTARELARTRQLALRRSLQDKVNKVNKANKTGRVSKSDDQQDDLQDDSQQASSVAQRALGVEYNVDQTGDVPADAVVLSEKAGALPENVKRFIVIRNACSVPPRETIREVKEVFGLTISSSRVARYDPTTAAGQTLREEYKRLYAAMRREAQLVADCIGAGDQGTRIMMLHQLCTQAVEDGDARTVLKILNQVYKEKQDPQRRELTEEQLALREKLRNTRPEDLPPVHRAKNHGAYNPAVPADEEGARGEL